jgi:hypothetical protein
MNQTDEDIRDAYAQLGAALAPPADAPDRISRRVAVRRRRRQATLAGAAAVVALGAVGTAALTLGSGGDGTDPTIAVDQPSPPEGPASTLVLTRPDGSTFAFDEVSVSCAAPYGKEGAQGPAEGRIWLTSPIRTEGGEVTEDDARVLEPFVYFEGVVDRLQGDRTFDLPVDRGDSDSNPFVLFMADPVVGAAADRANEVSSVEPGAAGTVRVVRAACEPTPVLELEVDATLGSEVDQGTLAIAGAVE